MSRWAPNARERLETAALDLFAENGYEETTVAQIADRAGLNRATFFRHFAEKREVLFGGEDVLAGLFAGAIRAASPDATVTECLQAAFAAAEVAMTPQQRAKAAQRVLVVAANSELQERGLLKHARIARSISAALRERGADELTARLGAEVGMLAFTIAVERWMEAGNDEPFPLHAAAALRDLQVRAAELGSPSRLSARPEFSGTSQTSSLCRRHPLRRPRLGPLVVAAGLHPVAAHGHRAPAGGAGLAAINEEQPALVVRARPQPPRAVLGQRVPYQHGPQGQFTFGRDGERPADLSVRHGWRAGYPPQRRGEGVRRLLTAHHRLQHLPYVHHVP